MDASNLERVDHERIRASRKLASFGNQANLTWAVAMKLLETDSMERSSRLGRERSRRLGRRALPQILRLRRYCVILGLFTHSSPNK